MAPIDLAQIVTFDYKSAINWLENEAVNVNGRNAYCLNDMNRFNCLIRETPDQFNEVVTLIDYEFASI